MPSRALPWSRARTINAGMVAIAALTARPPPPPGRGGKY